MNGYPPSGGLPNGRHSSSSHSPFYNDNNDMHSPPHTSATSNSASSNSTHTKGLVIRMSGSSNTRMEESHSTQMNDSDFYAHHTHAHSSALNVTLPYVYLMSHSFE